MQLVEQLCLELRDSAGAALVLKVYVVEDGAVVVAGIAGARGGWLPLVREHWPLGEWGNRGVRVEAYSAHRYDTLRTRQQVVQQRYQQLIQEQGDHGG